MAIEFIIEPDTPIQLRSGDNPKYVDYITHYVKKYPDRFKLIQYNTPYSSFVSKLVPRTLIMTSVKPQNDKLESREKSVQHTKTTLTDITICNDFDLFVTFTFNCRACIPKCTNKTCTCDKTTCKRYDLDYIIRTQKTWYNNQIKRYGRFPYVQVMELHKTKAYHFHALFKSYPGKLKFLKIDKKDGRPVYNLTSNRKGWTTVKEIYDISGTSSYIRKYIMKDMPLFPGKKRFWSSKGLKRPIVVQDRKLANKIMQNPKSTCWKPEDVILIEGKTVKRITSNISSITTLMADNKDDYELELEALECASDFIKATSGKA